jgi:hypothetical protein
LALRALQFLLHLMEGRQPRIRLHRLVIDRDRQMLLGRGANDRDHVGIDRSAVQPGARQGECAEIGAVIFRRERRPLARLCLVSRDAGPSAIGQRQVHGGDQIAGARGGEMELERHFEIAVTQQAVQIDLGEVVRRRRETEFGGLAVQIGGALVIGIEQPRGRIAKIHRPVILVARMNVAHNFSKVPRAGFLVDPSQMEHAGDISAIGGARIPVRRPRQIAFARPDVPHGHHAPLTVLARRGHRTGQRDELFGNLRKDQNCAKAGDDQADDGGKSDENPAHDGASS